MTDAADPSRLRPAGRVVCVGADVGATLTKLATRGADGSLRFRLVPSQAIERAAREVEQLRAVRVGLTGGGAPRLAVMLSALDTVACNEFEAWGAGTRALLGRQGEPPGRLDLLVSIGTGTAILLSGPQGVTRVGGSALGGGALLGLGSLLLGVSDFDELVRLATRGDRSRVDLMVSDLYQGGDAPLPKDLSAAAFAKLALPGPWGEHEPADLARSLVAVIGENVALGCGALAAATGAERIVFGGSTLRGNSVLREALARLSALGRPVIFLEDGEYAGAVGALESAAASSP